MRDAIPWTNTGPMTVYCCNGAEERHRRPIPQVHDAYARVVALGEKAPFDFHPLRDTRDVAKTHVRLARRPPTFPTSTTWASVRFRTVATPPSRRCRRHRSRAREIAPSDSAADARRPPVHFARELEDPASGARTSISSTVRIRRRSGIGPRSNGAIVGRTLLVMRRALAEPTMPSCEIRCGAVRPAFAASPCARAGSARRA